MLESMQYVRAVSTARASSMRRIGALGGGEIVVTPVDEVIRICTGEGGRDAI